ncbi:MAG: hypothetical protein K2I37_02665 [Muribaculaceae bacterium]|nr:hypothetical protein [Muribaculaceae bacterium]
MAKNKLNFFKKHPSDKTIWAVIEGRERGPLAITFDKKKILFLPRDYPHNLTAEEKEIFDKENPFWADFFKDLATENT